MSATGSGGFEGRVAVVTGGASGIGFALAERLVKESARVAILDLVPAAVDTAASGLGGVLGIPTDVTDETAVRAAVARVEGELGPVELYFSNAGIGGGLGLGGDEDWARAWAVHGMAHVYAARAVMPGMVARGHGEFVVTASAAGLLMMMQCLAPQGVRTPMVTADPRAEAEVAASGPILDPADVAEDVLSAISSGEFLVMPHPEVQGYEQAKVADRTRWLRTMRRLRARL
jgi:short-subunit dehydrogenase